MPQGGNRGVVVISNDTVPEANHDDLSSIGASDSLSSSTSSLFPDGDSDADVSSGGGFSTSTINSNLGIESLKMEANYYDSKESKVLVKGLRTAYKRVSWDGGEDAYLRLRLDKDDAMHPEGRGPGYSGQCVDEVSQGSYSQSTLNLTCTDTDPVDFKQPFVCTNSQGPVEGQLDNEEYRKQCEMPCTRKKDCSKLCACEKNCDQEKRGGYCECDACRDLEIDATVDKKYEELVEGDTTLVGGCLERWAFAGGGDLLQAHAV